MSDLLDKAVQRVRALPADRQDELARVLMGLAEGDEVVYQLSDEEEADLIEAQAELDRGEIATDAEVEAVFAKYRL